MMSQQNWRLYGLYKMQALLKQNFSDGLLACLDTPTLTENERALVKFIPGHPLDQSSTIFWKFFVTNNDLNMKCVPRDWRILSRHQASGISSDMILQPFVAEIIKCLCPKNQDFDQFHINSASTEACAFSIFSTLDGNFQAGTRIVLLKIIAEVVVKGEFKIEFLATVDVGTYNHHCVEFVYDCGHTFCLMQVGNSRVLDLHYINNIFAVVSPRVKENFERGLEADFSTSACFVEGSLDEDRLRGSTSSQKK